MYWHTSTYLTALYSSTLIFVRRCTTHIRTDMSQSIDIVAYAIFIVVVTYVPWAVTSSGRATSHRASKGTVDISRAIDDSVTDDMLLKWKWTCTAMHLIQMLQNQIFLRVGAFEHWLTLSFLRVCVIMCTAFPCDLTSPISIRSRRLIHAHPRALIALNAPRQIVKVSSSQSQTLSLCILFAPV